MINILTGDCRDVLKTLAGDSVHCVVTSPPYWGLRDYGVEGQLGLEKTPEEYIAVMVDVFREVRRVLRPDGTLWLNMGDSYNVATNKGRRYSATNNKNHGYWSAPHDDVRRNLPGLKPKDMAGMPWRLAFALQADGWWLRQDIVWSKPNPMPESVTDRCTKSHEYIFLLTKEGRYFFDQEAIREKVTGHAHRRSAVKPPARWGVGDEPRTAIELQREGVHRKTKPGVTPKSAEPGSGIKANESFHAACMDLVTQRNKRSVWTVASAPYSEAHFATFPPDLIKPCILAGTSSRGCCPQCGAPWRRVVESGAPDLEHQRACGGDSKGEYHGEATKDYAGAKAQDASATKARILAGMVEKKTTGWEPTCEHGLEPIPCTILDCFGGSGTSGQVALELGRSAILIELNESYITLANARCQVTPGLPLA